jgi:hypothetical protein
MMLLLMIIVNTAAIPVISIIVHSVKNVKMVSVLIVVSHGLVQPGRIAQTIKKRKTAQI